MAITATTRTDIIELVVLATSGAPGVTQLSKLVAAYESGTTMAGIAATLTASSAFKAIYPTFQTPTEFASEFLDNVVPGISVAAKAEGVLVITGLLNSGSTVADILVVSANFLSNTATTDANFGTYASLFQNKTAVAYHHTITLELDTNLAGALTGVTAAAATVTAARATLDASTPAAIAAAAKVVAAAAAAKVISDAAAAKVISDAAAAKAVTDAAAAKVISDAAAKAVTDAAAAKAVTDAQI